MTTKQLNCRQAKWAEFLSEFNFRITYRPGKEGEKPDTLTRLSQDKPKGFDDSRQQHQFQTLLKADQLDDNNKKALAVVFCANEANEANKVDEIDEVNEIDEVDKVDEVENENIVDVRDYTGLDLRQHTSEEQNLELSSSSTGMAGSRIKNSLEDLLNESYQNDKVANGIIAAKRAGLRKLPANLTTKQSIKLAMEDLTIKGNRSRTRLYVKRRMYIPNEKNLQLFLLKKHHDPPIQGHPGYKAMLWKLLENWYWLGMPRVCKQYATNCSTCRRTKAYTSKKQSLLNPLSIPNRKWMDLSLDFVMELPECHRRDRIFCHILVVVDRLRKRQIYEPLEGLSTSEFIEAMHRQVFSAHGYPLSIVNDRGGQMTSTL